MALVGNEVVGSMMVANPDDTSGLRNIEIDWIEVNPNNRKMGIATKMLNFFIDDLATNHPEVVWLSFWTGEDLERNGGFTLYEKIGLKQVYVQEDYYDKGVSTRLFVKRIH